LKTTDGVATRRGRAARNDDADIISLVGALEGIAGGRAGCWTEKDVEREEDKNIGFPAITICLAGGFEEMVCTTGEVVVEGLD
jgi:hypothetical protein